MIGKPSYKEVGDAHQHVDPAKLAEYTIIPENRYGVTPGYYDNRDLTALLRSAFRRKATSGTLSFIVDMME
jgi:hypothetical protein